MGSVKHEFQFEGGGEIVEEDRSPKHGILRNRAVVRERKDVMMLTHTSRCRPWFTFLSRAAGVFS